MNKKNIYLVVTLVVLALLGGLIFWAGNKNSQPRELVVSGHPAWPPIMYQQGDKIVGAGPEILAKIFAELGVQAVFKYEGSWDQVQEKAKTGAVDVLVAAYKTAERETYMDYSIPYTVDPVILVVKKGKTFSYNQWADLIGKKGAITIGDSYGQAFDNYLKEKLTTTTIKTPAEAFELLKNGQADYFVYALYSAEDYITKNKISDQFEIIPTYISAENFYLTISRESPFVNLLPQINTLLEKYKTDGTIEKIIKSYRPNL